MKYVYNEIDLIKLKQFEQYVYFKFYVNAEKVLKKGRKYEFICET